MQLQQQSFGALPPAAEFYILAIVMCTEKAGRQIGLMTDRSPMPNFVDILSLFLRMCAETPSNLTYRHIYIYIYITGWFISYFQMVRRSYREVLCTALTCVFECFPSIVRAVCLSN